MEMEDDNDARRKEREREREIGDVARDLWIVPLLSM